MDVSIIICCYNSTQKLPRTLEHLAKQKLSADLSYEVIVVDNASTDNTAEFAMSYWGTLNTDVPLRVVREDTPGLVYARICGVHAAQYELLIFCDDDNWLREDYVQNAYDLMNQMPDVGVLGGQSVLAPHIDAPDWWEEHQGNYAVGKQLLLSGYANERGFLYGAGMVTRKSLAKKIFDSQYPLLLIGRKGNQCFSGEDWEYCQRMLLLGYNLYYSEDLYYIHEVSPDRLTINNLQQLLKSFEITKSIGERYRYIIKYYNQPYICKLLLWLKRVIIYIFVKSKYKARKLELLKFQTQICGFKFMRDVNMEQILGWTKMNKQ